MYRFPVYLLLGSVAAVGCTQEWIATPSNPLPVFDIGDGGKGGTGETGGAGGTGGSAGSGGMGIPAGPCMPDPGNPEIVKIGTVPSKTVLIGCVITPEGPINGSVFISNDTIQCVGASCVNDADAVDATVVRTHGVIMPGMIDTHNHILFDIFNADDWSPMQSYENHDQWPQDARYGAMVDAKQYLNGELAIPDTTGVSAKIPNPLGCEMNKYGEMKGLIAGTTSIVGSANPLDKTCFGSLARTIDQKPNDLNSDKVQVATITPSKTTADGVCQKFADDATDAYIIHRGEGIDEYSRSEFDKLGLLTTTPNCLYAPETAIVHGTAFGTAEFQIMADHGMGLVWSPRSNVFLYGAGTDYTKTTDVKTALGLGINVALAPDWSIGGSANLLEELQFADEVDKNRWNDEVLSPELLVQMVTTNAAKALGLDGVLGSLEVGKKADITVIWGDVAKPYDTIVAAKPRDVAFVMVNGVGLYGDTAIRDAGSRWTNCEELDICGTLKFACVAEPLGTDTDKFQQTWAEITTVLSTELENYDARNLSQWDFAPLAPLVNCN
ncbi:MAG TPA: amidohydrolase family protein [Polyangium sp.]|nr:amidohydrolase family protein [Polyangium sp.]